MKDKIILKYLANIFTKQIENKCMSKEKKESAKVKRASFFSKKSVPCLGNGSRNISPLNEFFQQFCNFYLFEFICIYEKTKKFNPIYTYIEEDTEFNTLEKTIEKNIEKNIENKKEKNIGKNIPAQDKKKGIYRHNSDGDITKNFYNDSQEASLLGKSILFSPNLKEINNNVKNNIYFEYSNNNKNTLGFKGFHFNIENILIVYIYYNNDLEGLVVMGNKYVKGNKSMILGKKMYASIDENIIEEIKPELSLFRYLIVEHIYNVDIKYKDNNNFPSKELFLASMSHEIRTPLNGIIGYNQLLGKTELNNIQKNYLNSMNQCCIQLMEIVNDVLDFAKLTSEKMLINEECFTVKECVDYIKNIIGSKFLEKKQKLIVNIDDKIPVFIITDKGKLTQILLNILSNANKFSPERSGKIILNINTSKGKSKSISEPLLKSDKNKENKNDGENKNKNTQYDSKSGTLSNYKNDIISSISRGRNMLKNSYEEKESLEDGDNYLLFEIIDNGNGISESDLPLLFNVYRQLDNANSKAGTGLGLSIAKKLIELLGGSISVRSELGVGSIFSFNIKYTEKENMEKLLVENMHLLENKYILLVDDNHNNRVVLSDYLFEWKMNPISCGSGIEAMKYIESGRYKFSMCLIDIIMPEMSGSELATIIKEIDDSLPIIALSSSSSYIDNKIFEYKLDKPIDKLKLFNIIFKVLKKDNTDFILNRDMAESYNGSLRKKDMIMRVKKNIRILIAEDVFYNYELLRDILKNLGYKNVSIAVNGKECIKKIRKSINPPLENKDERKNKEDRMNKDERGNNLPKSDKKHSAYDILFLDLKMPVIDGYGVIDYIIRKNIDINIVVVSASVLESEKKKCMKLGVKYFIPKPIEVKNISNVINHIIL